MTFNPRYHPPAVIVNVTRVGLRSKKSAFWFSGLTRTRKWTICTGW